MGFTEAEAELRGRLVKILKEKTRLASNTASIYARRPGLNENKMQRVKLC
jgi:hypothetical protein